MPDNDKINTQGNKAHPITDSAKKINTKIK